jgi:hypothetical protein
MCRTFSKFAIKKCSIYHFPSELEIFRQKLGILNIAVKQLGLLLFLKGLISSEILQIN